MSTGEFCHESAPATGYYYDGVSSRPLPVTIRITDQGLNLVVSCTGIEPQNIAVPRSEIHDVEPISKEVCIVRIGANERVSLEIHDTCFLLNFRRKLGRTRLPGIAYSIIISLPLLRISLIFALVTSIIGTGYFWALPAIAESAAIRTPQAYEARIGKSMAQHFMSTENVDTAATRLVGRFADELELKGKYPLRPIVLKSNIPNAYAIPGGTVVILDSILTLIKTSGEFAALLAHEQTHIEKRHTLRIFYRSISAFALVSFLFGDASGFTAILLDNAGMLKALQYQRAMETEADECGARFMASRGLDPGNSILLLRRLQKIPQAQNLYQWFSTHPALEARIEHLAKLNLSYSPDTLLDENLRIIWTDIRKSNRPPITSRTAKQEKSNRLPWKSQHKTHRWDEHYCPLISPGRLRPIHSKIFPFSTDGSAASLIREDFIPHW